MNETFTAETSSRAGVTRTGCVVVAGGVLLVALIVAWMLAGRYNQLVGLEERVEAAWSEIDNQYRRRYDLVPQLVATVQGAAEFEKSTFEAVTEARASVGRAQLPAGLPESSAQLEAYVAAQQGLGAALGRLFAVVENYPELKANQNFLSLQDQLEGTENRIAVARRDYIDSVRDYNVYRRRFPTNLVSGVFGFEPVPQLEIEEGQRQRPEVDFQFKNP